MLKRYVVATRKSELALKQTELAVSYLISQLVVKQQAIRDPVLSSNEISRFETLPLTTKGDRDQSIELGRSEHKGLFVKELELALLRGDADIAVHSAKDIPIVLPDGLSIAGYLPREEANEVLVFRKGADIKTIATDSLRRRAQLLKIFPNVEWRSMRGNIKTRLMKIASGYADATLLASAGLKRLGIDSWPQLAFKKYSLTEIVPAVGQGAIAIQCRTDDVPFWRPLLDFSTFLAVEKERQLLAESNGGCGSAFAAHVRGEEVIVF
ncbi:MAG: hydroxymethylbilane synthase [Verrucomicrobia bacterium GWC2_42_7]|nr:MAG: hydroxymethylbilane synthase [Verrucomicrobia bacterium GWC2_42_7]